MKSIPLAPAVMFRAVTTTLDHLGFSSERMVEGAGLPQWQLLESHSKIPGPHLYRLLGHAARVLGTEGFGLVVPDHLPLTSVGSFGKAIAQSLTVYDAINTLNRLYPRFSNTSRFFVHEEPRKIWWLRKCIFSADAGLRQMELYSLAYMINLIRMGAGTGWRPTQVCVEADSISGLTRCDDFVEAEILRRRGVSGFAIPRSVLSRRMPSQTSKALEVEDRFLSDPPANEFIRSLRQAMRSFVRIGHPQIEAIADTAGMGVRTLQRRLKEESLTFKKVVDQARFQVAVDLLGEKDVTLVDIAHELSYSDQAHFNHAFRRWAGLSPGQYRSQLQLN